MNTFLPADILIPVVDSMEKWSVIACDQFSSQPEYWEKVSDYVKDEPSTLHMILPEAELGLSDEDEKIDEINRTMVTYIDAQMFREYKDAFIYVERTLASGKIRRGLIGVVDLEAYDYKEDSTSNIRATEKTVLERIPPRMKIRKDAALEFPHVQILCDDAEKSLIEPIGKMKTALEKLYDFELMEGGGHIAGWLVQGDVKDAFELRLHAYERSLEDKYMDISGVPMTFAVGDGNHSLATAKACYEELKKSSLKKNILQHPARYALVELENIHDDALNFEPIHRILIDVDPEILLKDLMEKHGTDDLERGCPITWYSGDKSGTFLLDVAKNQLAVGVLQPYLDTYLAENGGRIDYIHEDQVLIDLAGQKNAIGFLLPAMEKSQLFRGVITDGVLPRKTFSMGHAYDKRYYLEGRKLSEK